MESAAERAQGKKRKLNGDDDGIEVNIKKTLETLDKTIKELICVVKDLSARLKTVSVRIDFDN